jgi:hypothetical protein
MVLVVELPLHSDVVELKLRHVLAHPATPQLRTDRRDELKKLTVRHSSCAVRLFSATLQREGDGGDAVEPEGLMRVKTTEAVTTTLTRAPSSAQPARKDDAYSVSALLEDLRDLRSSEPRTKAELDAWQERAMNVARRVRASPVVCGLLPPELWHYFSDAEVRLKDETYARPQLRRVDAAIEGLRQRAVSTQSAG